MSGTVRIGFDSNVGSVIDSIEDVKEDIPYEMRKRVGAAMRVVWSDAKQYVIRDSNHTGQLFSAIKRDTIEDGNMLSFTVGVDLERVPYAAIVEFGSGKRSNRTTVRADSWTPAIEGWPRTGSAVPFGYPFESPDIEFNHINPFETGPFPKFYGFAKHIEDWMKTKPVEPKFGNYYTSAVLIAAKIIRRGNYAHPYLRPAWFDNELNVKRAARNALRNAVR